MNARSIMAIFVAGLLFAGCAADTKTAPVTMDQTPLSVRMGIAKAFPDAQITEVRKEIYQKDGIVHFQVKLVTRDGLKQEIEFTPDGELLEKH